MKTDGSERFNVFGRPDGSKCLNQIFSSIGLGGGEKVQFLTPLIRNSGTSYALKICTMFINMLYKRIDC